MIAPCVHQASATILAAVLIAACGGKELNLGHDDSFRKKDYATPESIAAEADAGPGIPTIIANHQYNASGVSVDDTRLYWLTDFTGWGGRGFVRSCAKADCAGTLITYTDESIPVHFPVQKTAVTSTHLFWTGSVDLSRVPSGSGFDFEVIVAACPISGCAPRPATIFAYRTRTRELLDFVVDESQFFGLIRDQYAATATIVRCPVTGCQGQSTLLATLTQLPDPPSTYAFAADTDNLYWIAGVGSSHTAGQIMTMPKSGATLPRVLAPAGHLVGALATFGGNLYWSEGHSVAAVKTCELSNCEPTTRDIATAQRYPHHLTVHGDSAAWFAPVDGINSVPADIVALPMDTQGRTPIVFPTREQFPSSLAIDDTHIYWTTTSDDSGGKIHPFPEGGGSVKRARRPQ